ncbi:MAG: phosphatidylserine decarboxylase [Myxococcales bacterium]|nr:phosphatidylserine decarboxylase [Myxococcales bacterium]
MWPTRLYSRTVQSLANLPLPKAARGTVISGFARVVGANVAEAEKPAAAYRSLGDFFGRKLRDGARQLDVAPGVLAAPCDGVVMSLGTIEDDGTIIGAKGVDYAVNDLLALPDGVTSEFAGGQFAVIYLSPKDYHRVHAPVTCQLRGYRYVPGALWPVSPFFVRHVRGLFARNERVVFELTPDVALIMVSAVGVGHVRVKHWPSAADMNPDAAEHGFETGHLRGKIWEQAVDVAITAGDELGTFLLGSTVVLLFRAGTARLALTPGHSVRVGESIGTFAVSSPPAARGRDGRF